MNPEEPIQEPEIKLDKRSASKAVAWLSLYATISRVVFPLLGLYISRTLGPDPLGAYALIMTIIAFSEVFRDAGLAQTFLAETDVDKEKEGAYFAVSICTGILPAIALVALSPWFASFFHVPELAWALPITASVLVMNGLATIPRVKMLRAGQIKLTGAIEVVGSGLALAITIAMVAMGFGFVSLIAQVLFTGVYTLVSCWIRYPVRSIRFNVEAFKRVGRKAGVLLAANGINQLFLFADHIVINKFAGTTANGLFGQAAALAYKPADLLVFPLTRTLTVAFSQSAVDLKRLASVYSRSITAAILLVVPIYSFLALFGKPLILLLLTDKFAGSAEVLPAMCLYVGLRTFGNISGSTLVPAGKHAMTLYPWFVAVIGTGIALYLVLGGRGGFPDPDLMMPVVWCFAGGATFVYVSLTILGLYYCRPTRDEGAKMLRAMGIVGATFILLAAFLLLPIPAVWQMASAAVFGPIAHLAVLGTFLAKNPLYYLNRTGPKRLWSEL